MQSGRERGINCIEMVNSRNRPAASDGGHARTQGRARGRAGTRSEANLAGGAAGTITRSQCGRGGIGRRDGLDANLSALPGNRRCRTAQIRGNLSNGNPEPSPAGGREGVETRRAAPKAFSQGEGIVQTTNPASSGAAKAAAGKKIRLPQGSGGSSPPARTKKQFTCGVSACP